MVANHYPFEEIDLPNRTWSFSFHSLFETVIELLSIPLSFVRLREVLSASWNGVSSVVRTTLYSNSSTVFSQTLENILTAITFQPSQVPTTIYILKKAVFFDDW